MPPPTPEPGPCLHCGAPHGHRKRRGLCRRCFADRGVRGQFPPPPRCLHCRSRSRPPRGRRGLCPICHGDHAIRRQYPIRRQHGGPPKPAGRCPACTAVGGRTHHGWLCDACYRDPAKRAAFPAPPCRHCHRHRWLKARGLCKECHAVARAEYAPRSPPLEFDTADGVEMPLPATPTAAIPGSEEKVLVMMARFDKREALFHPDDAGMDVPGLVDLYGQQKADAMTRDDRQRDVQAERKLLRGLDAERAEHLRKLVAAGELTDFQRRMLAAAEQMVRPRDA